MWTCLRQAFGKKSEIMTSFAFKPIRIGTIPDESTLHRQLGNHADWLNHGIHTKG